MKLDVVAEGPLERIASALGVVPTPVVRVLFSVALPRIVLPALELGVFPAIAGGAATVEDIARVIGCHLEGTRALLAGLNGFGFVKRKRGRYALAPSTKKWLVQGQKDSLYDAVAFCSTLDEMMQCIPEAVRTGKRGGLHEQPHSPEWWTRYLRGLGAVARGTRLELVRRVTLKAPKRLLDVAGGHGMYAAGFVKRHAGLQATVLDLPEACAVGRAMVVEEQLADRFAFVTGDLRTTPWPDQQDVVLLFNILHNLAEPDARAAISRAHTSLAPGGVLLILDGEHAGGDGDLNTAEGFGECFFFAISNSSVWPAETLRAWCAEAGFASTTRKKLFSFPNTVFLTARRSA